MMTFTIHHLYVRDYSREGCIVIYENSEGEAGFMGPFVTGLQAELSITRAALEMEMEPHEFKVAHKLRNN